MCDGLQTVRELTAVAPPLLGGGGSSDAPGPQGP
jgi:hypothetical protein